MIRTHLVKSLYENLLGPKFGNNEIIEQPFLKYELGILNSSFSLNSTDNQHILDSEINPEPSEIDNEKLDNPIPENTQNSEMFRQEIDTEINLKSGSFSLGLSFVLKGDVPRFKACMTWARYLRDTQFGSTPRMFKRNPNFFVYECAVNDSPNSIRQELKNDINGNQVTDSGIYMHIRKIKMVDGRWVIKIFLENKTIYDTSKSQTEKDRIFQPQIRIRLYDSELSDLDFNFQQDKQYENDDLLYLKHRTKARGYLCAAVWKDIDPETDQNSPIAKLSWPDYSSVPEDVKNTFMHSDVRTEYLPLYTILQPDTGKYTLSAHELSQTWNPDDINKILKPIVQNYSDWIKLQHESLDKDQQSGIINHELKNIGEKNLEECDNTNQRIKAGIDFLRTNERARAAFCFMNVVMNDKRSNEENESLYWREFQMAFILQSLRGVTGESQEERDVSDVLWFPTGGGKTEAYLGIVIFAIAYRRLSPSGKLSNDGGVSVISRYTLRLLTIQQFQRALGAIVAADIRRVENWLPDGAKYGAYRISDTYMVERLKDKALWGWQRFSIGMWIGTDTTPKDFGRITGKGGIVFPNAEGALLCDEKNGRRYKDGGDPTQIQTCPICKCILCLPKEQKDDNSITMTWIINSPKSLDDLQKIPKKEFEYSNNITLKEDPIFDHIVDSPNGIHYYRLTMEINPTRKVGRKTVNEWWYNFVKPQLDPNTQHDSLESTSPSTPGYFFLEESGSGKRHDFAIFCPNKRCKLNNTEWFEKIEGKYDALIPIPFQTDGSSRSVPISAFVIDEQVYFKCPSLLIATVDKFANLPFEPKCASLFGNVDVVHPIYGYGRRAIFESPLRKSSNQRMPINDNELHKVSGFNPPSLILQDELHLIEGPLGSMVGIYEMAVDVLCSHESRPKYIASSATIKESKSQVGTIFRRDVKIFPPLGIDAHDNHFSQIEEDVGCTSKQPGRLYLGMSSTKSTVTLPIKTQSWVMSEIFRIKSNPDDYDLTDDEKKCIEKETEPYWTFVSYFTDLQILAKFTNYYTENIMDNVSNWSPVIVYNSTKRAPNRSMEPRLRLFTVKSDHNMDVSKIIVYCTNNKGKIKIALYKAGDSIGDIIHKFDYKDCREGGSEFDLIKQHNIKKGERIWVAIINDDKNSEFQSVISDEDSLEDTSEMYADFPDTLKKLDKFSGDPIKISLCSQSRVLREDSNIILSSQTKSEDLAQNLERLKSGSDVDSLQTSPVFGTGIDVDRLGLMEIMNQPKTNSGYIQSSGRVGRTTQGLIINWLRAGRARDLNHYENFVGYHRMLHRFVEPVTASPFSNKTMNLCLGPIIVAILRNARSVSGQSINSNWISDKGPNRMSDHDNDPEIDAIEKKLEQISSSEFIAEFRRMPKERFKHIFKELKGLWHQLATDLYEDETREFVYEERQPNRPPSRNVVLGTPNHKDLGLDFAYEDVPNSLRQTESTSAFYNSADIVQIRPSQFITRYGPGTLISRKTTTWIIPTLKDLVYDLKDKGNFEESDTTGIKKLYKYEIDDSRMKRLIRRFNPYTSWNKLKFFSLPTNSSLTLEEGKQVYRCKEFPQWSICHSRHHPAKRVLGKTSYDKNRLVVKCPECERISGNKNSTEFYSVRYVVACKNGHLGDLNWKFEVHKSERSQSCRGDVFEWIISDTNDNVDIICLGHWEQDSFVSSTCNARTNYLELKHRSNNGKIDCSGKFAELESNSEGCPRINGISQAKMISKTQMSIRLPVIATTMEIQKYKGELFELYVPLRQMIVTLDKTNQIGTKDEFIHFLELQRSEMEEITNSHIRATRKSSDAEFKDVIGEIKEFNKTMNNNEESLTERKALEDELVSLERQTRENGAVQIGPNDPPTDIRFPISISVRGMNFEVMPFENIKVTQVQSGYTREISPPVQENVQNNPDERNDDMRIGNIVSISEKFIDENDVTWYLANQLKGEGIFIHLDPKQHSDAMDVFNNIINPPYQKKWERIHKETVQRNNTILKRIRNEKEKQKEVDAREMENVFTNPLFVWWHSFAHGLINQLSIDSGFMGVSLGERVYLRERSDGVYSAGIFIYASNPGADGTLGGLISLVNEDIFSSVVENTLEKFQNCSNDPVCIERHVNDRRRTGAACHICLMNSETSCSYQNRFLDRNLVLVSP